MTTTTSQTTGSDKKKVFRFPLKMSKRTMWISLTVFILALAGGGTYYYQTVYLPSTTTSSSETMQTAVVRQGDLVLYASGSGTLISASETNLAFKADGRVASISVKAGDQVKEGDLLAQLDDSDAKAAYEEANRALLELTSPSAIANAQQAIVDAGNDVDTARSRLAYVISPEVLRAEEKVAAAEQSVNDAQAAVNSSPSDADAKKKLDDENAALEKAKTALSQAQVWYNYTYVYKTFLTDEKKVEPPTEMDILEARAQYALAKATLAEAQYLYAALTGGDVPADATGTGLSDLRTAQTNLETAKDALDGTQIVAPASGTVMSVDTEVGDSVSSGTSVITVADLNQPYIQAYLDESDWEKVKVGKDVEITFDILPDQTFQGTVSEVDPSLYTESGSSVVRALVKLDLTDVESFNLPLGTSASVDVIGGQAKDAVLVPIEALQQAGDQYAVFVLENGEPVLHVIEIGIQDDIYAEVKSGLNPGDVVTTGITVTK